MADHLSDEEQVEALKRWWRKNGTALLLAIVVGGGGWFGWNYWQESSQQKAENSSLVYMAMLDALARWEQERLDDSAAAAASHAETLKKLGDDNLYGVFGAMVVAKLAMADGDMDTAVAELEWARERAADEPALEALVDLRLAAAEFGRGNNDRALALLDRSYPETYTALYEELNGDIFAARGDNQKASDAYRVALENLAESDTRSKAILNLKINELGVAAEGSAAVRREDT